LGQSNILIGLTSWSEMRACMRLLQSKSKLNCPSHCDCTRLHRLPSTQRVVVTGRGSELSDLPICGPEVLAGCAWFVFSSSPSLTVHRTPYTSCEKPLQSLTQSLSRFIQATRPTRCCRHSCSQFIILWSEPSLFSVNPKTIFLVLN